MAAKKISKTLRIEKRSYKLREAEVDDAQRIADFAGHLPEQDISFLRIDLTDAEFVAEWLRGAAGAGRTILLAEREEEIAGYASLNRRGLRWDRHMGEIRVLVAEAERGSGLGRTLAREIFEIAKERGLSKIVARMMREQRGARRLFEKLDFQPEALLADWVIDAEGKTHDLVIMSHDVTSLR